MKPILLMVGVMTASGCGVQISDGDRVTGGADAQPSTADAGDENGETSTDAAPGPDAGPAVCGNGRVVFLQFEGVSLKSTQVRSDATLDAAYWAGGPLALPPFRQASATRTQDIAEITAVVRAQLAAVPVTVVTTRPTTGPYVMIVFGGRLVGGDNNSIEYYAINTLDCGDAWASDVGWVSDISQTNTLAADYALGAIGYGLGLSGTTDPADCMCGWGSTCDSADVACTFGTNAAAPLCPGAADPQNEVAAIEEAFCSPL